MNFLKAALAAVLAFASPVTASLRVIFSPAELTHAFTASLAASSTLGFVVAFVSTIGNDAAANPSAGIVGGIVSFALLRVAARLAALEAPKPAVPPAPVPVPAPAPARPTDPTGSLPPTINGLCDHLITGTGTPPPKTGRFLTPDEITSAFAAGYLSVEQAIDAGHFDD